MTVRIKELREKRAKLIKDAQIILTTAADANRELTGEERSQWDTMVSQADALMETISREERQLQLSQELAQPIERRAGREAAPILSNDRAERDAQHTEAFRSFIRYGMERLPDEHRSLLLAMRSPEDERNLNVGTGSAGGFTVPQGFRATLEEALLAFGGMLNVATTFTTSTGNPLPMPSVNDTANQAAIVAEAGGVGASVNPTFASVNLGAFMYRALTTVSLELLADSAFDIEGLLARQHGNRHARIQNSHFTTGTGTGQPRGISIDSVSGRVGATGQTTSVTYADLVLLEHSVDPEYRPNARFMFNDSTLSAIKRLLDGQNRPLWAPGIGVGQPDRILGYPYVINQAVAVMAANARSVFFGDLSKYFIRRVQQMTIVRANERYIENGLVGFFTFSRADGRLLDAGTNPVKFYQNSAT